MHSLNIPTINAFQYLQNTLIMKHVQKKIDINCVLGHMWIAFSWFLTLYADNTLLYLPAEHQIYKILSNQSRYKWSDFSSAKFRKLIIQHFYFQYSSVIYSCIRFHFNFNTFKIFWKVSLWFVTPWRGMCSSFGSLTSCNHPSLSLKYFLITLFNLLTFTG